MQQDWSIVELPGAVAVVPEDETQEHQLDSYLCPCQPTVSLEGQFISLITHNSFKHRAIVETRMAELNLYASPEDTTKS